MKIRYNYFGILVFIALLSTYANAQNTNIEKFNQGVTQFSSAAYKEALQSWTEVYNTGYRSADLDYNIGNAYFKLNDIPNAILFYERAYLLKPTDENINYNLQIARTLIVDRFKEIPELFFVRWFNLISLFLSSNLWAVISLTSFIISLLFLSLYLYSSKFKNKVIGFWVAMFFIALSGSALTFSIRNNSLVFNSNKAIISSPLVNGKSSPDNSGNDLFILHEGTKISIEDEVGDWYEIRLSDGNKGWVPAKSLIKI
jgi:tetratricopeptide (TPR) repeat protein